MSSSSSSSYSPQQRRNKNNSQQLSTFKSVVAAGLVAYGTYKVWNYSWSRKNEDEDAEHADDTPSSNAAAPPIWDSFLRSSLFTGSVMDDMFISDNSGRHNVANHHHHHTTSIRTSHRWKMRRQRMTRCRTEVQQAMEGFLPTLREVVEDATSTLSSTRALKNIRQQRQKQQQAQATATTGVDSSHSDNNNDNNSNVAIVVDAESNTIKNDHLEFECWRDIQEQTLTRMLTTAYAHTILFLVLTTQVNLLGGRLLEEAVEQDPLLMTTTNSNSNHNINSGAYTPGNSYNQQQQYAVASTSRHSSVASSARMTSYQASHRNVLQHTYSYFLDTGLQLLLDTVRKAVRRVLEDVHHYNALDADCQNISVERFLNTLDELRSLVEDGLPLSSPHRKPHSLLRFLMPIILHDSTTATSSPNGNGSGDSSSGSPGGSRNEPTSPYYHTPAAQAAAANNTATTDDDDYAARAILNETWDLVESPVFIDAQVDAWNTTFDMMRQVWGNVFVVDEEEEEETAAAATTITESSADGSRQLPHAAAAIPPRMTARPWAKILTQLKYTTNSFYKSSNNNNNNNAAARQRRTQQPPLSVSMESLQNHRQRQQHHSISTILPQSYCSMMEALPTVLELADVSFN